MSFVLNFSAQNGFDYVHVNVTDLENLLLLASDILDCPAQDVLLFLFVDGTLIDENEYLKMLDSWTELFICEPCQKEKLSIYFDIKRYCESRCLLELKCIR